MQVLDYLGIIDTGEEDRLYKDPVVVVKVKGDVYAAVDTKEKTVKFYPFWTPMTKFDVGGFFIVTLRDQISEKIKMKAERIVAGLTEREKGYAYAKEAAERDKAQEGGLTSADERWLKKCEQNLKRWRENHPDDGKYVNLF